MDILDAMDLLLASAAERGRKPRHWIIRQDDWDVIGEQFRAGNLPDPAAIGAITYKEVPVHFGNLNNRGDVGLMDWDGQEVTISEPRT
jgi:hypothetical protein